MLHTSGISYEGDIIDMGVNEKVINRSGAWFKYGDVYLGQGKEKARAYLLENPKVTEEIREKVLASGTPATAAADTAASEE